VREVILDETLLLLRALQRRTTRLDVHGLGPATSHTQLARDLPFPGPRRAVIQGPTIYSSSVSTSLFERSDRKSHKHLPGNLFVRTGAQKGSNHAGK